MNRLGKLLMSMLKVGCIGFGGGNALIPVIEKEIVKEQKLVSQEEYNKFVVVSNITPGALPVEMAVALGKAIAGIPGMLLAPICIALPGGLATLLLIIAFAKFSHTAILQTQYISVGIAAYILYMLFLYNKKVIDSFELVEMKLKRIAVILCVCVLTFGKELYHILGVKAQPIFDISTIHVLLLAFFVIFSTGKGMTKRRFCIDLIVSLCYVLCVGKTQIITNVYFLRVLYLIMFLIAANGIYESFSGQVTKVKRDFRHVLKEEFVFLALIVICAIPALLMCHGAYSYMLKGYASSVISFGGGEAYLTVADSMFTGQQITETQLYSQLLPVVNALPGSILTKMLAGVGFYYGINSTQSIAAGIAVAIAGFIVAISASGAVLCAVMYIYEIFEQLTIFELLGKCIKPIIGGLLISTGLALFYQEQVIMKNCGVGLLGTIIFFLVLFFIITLLRKNKKIPDVVIILVCGIASVILCNSISELF